MDAVVAFLSSVVELSAAAGAELARYPLVLVVGAVAITVSIVVLVGVVAAAACSRRWRGWPWRAHLIGLAVALGVTAALHIDARMAALTGRLQRLELVERIGVVEAAMPHDGATGGRPLIDATATRARLASILPRFDLDIARLDPAVDFATVRATHSAPIVAYVAVVDLTDPGIRIVVTGQSGAKSLTSEFARQNDCIVAINGEAGESPAPDAALGRYAGNWIAAGVPVMLEDTARRPFIKFDRANRAQVVPTEVVDTVAGPDKYNALWGRGDLLRGGSIDASERTRWMRSAPRTLMGLDAQGDRLVLMVVDGRQPEFSVGLDLPTAAAVLAAFDVSDAMWCDQGGSSTMVLGCLDGVVNQPCDGIERPVYVHFGVSRD